MKADVLIVEDDSALRELICDELETEGYQVLAADSLAAAREQLRSQRFDLLVTDLKLPDGSGHDVLELIDALDARPACLMITAFGSVREAVAALKRGADDFLTKPLDMDHFLLTVQRLVEHQRMHRELLTMRGLLDSQAADGIIGSSPVMQRLKQQILLIAPADGPVLILGESGSGKELVAKALHRHSTRAQGPFVAVNCAGIPRELIESELFGHEAGAFTGARARREGIFQQAHGGTLLLDEIGEMPVELQAKLLRVLQEGQIRPVGANTELELDVRVFAATHRDIHTLVSEGAFREDLYYRLETFSIEVPALRERGDDIELLALYFMQKHATRLDRDIVGLAPASLAALRAYDFPGNVRELSNVVERAVVFTRGKEVTLDSLPARVTRSRLAESDQSVSELLTDLPTLDALQKRYVSQVLQRVDGNKQRAAAILGVSRGTLYRWLDSDAMQSRSQN